MKRSTFILSLTCALVFASSAAADVYITEWMYKGDGGEFIEFTNLGDAPVDMSGWQFVDSHYPESDSFYDLSGFGLVQPGESVVLTEVEASAFCADWNIDDADGTKVLGWLGDPENGGAGENIGRDDTLYLLDAGLSTVDVLDYDDDETYPGSIRTQYVSGNPETPAALGANDVYQWVYSADGDAFGSYHSTSGDLGNPGAYVPEPASVTLLVLGGALMTLRRR